MSKSSDLNRKVMTAKEVSLYLKIPASSLWRLTKLGKIRGVRVGKHWRYLEGDILDLLHGRCNSSDHPGSISERRRSTRINCAILSEVRAILADQEPLSLSGTIRNLSAEGALVALENGGGRHFEIGDPLEILFEVSEISPPRMEFKARVVNLSVNPKMRLHIKFRLMTAEQRKALQDYVG